MELLRARPSKHKGIPYPCTACPKVLRQMNSPAAGAPTPRRDLLEAGDRRVAPRNLSADRTLMEFDCARGRRAGGQATPCLVLAEHQSYRLVVIVGHHKFF
jgi:hypothetical protein